MKRESLLTADSLPQLTSHEGLSIRRSVRLGARALAEWADDAPNGTRGDHRPPLRRPGGSARGMGGRRGPDRLRPERMRARAAPRAGRAQAEAAAAHAHPLRPRGRDRRTGRALARSDRVRASARRCAPDRPIAARGQRPAGVRRALRSAPWRRGGGAGGEPANDRARAAHRALPSGLDDDPTAHIAQLREALDRHERWAREGEDVFVQRLSDYLRAHLPPSAAEDYEFTSMARPSAAGLRRWLERAETAQKAEATRTAG